MVPNNISIQQSAKSLAEDHWDWLKSVLEAVPGTGLLPWPLLGVIYKSAFIHGWKHAEERYAKTD
mgnify:CR=1 FL=1